MHWNNRIASTLRLLLRREPLQASKVMIVATCSTTVKEQFPGLLEGFDAVVRVPQLSDREHFLAVLNQRIAFRSQSDIARAIDLLDRGSGAS